MPSKPVPIRIKYTEDEFYEKDWSKALKLIEQVEAYEQMRKSIRTEANERIKQISKLNTKIRLKLRDFSIKSKHRQKKINIVKNEISKEKKKWLKTLTTDELIEFIRNDNKEYIEEHSKKPSLMRFKHHRDVLKRLEKIKKGEKKWES